MVVPSFRVAFSEIPFALQIADTVVLCLAAIFHRLSPCLIVCLAADKGITRLNNTEVTARVSPTTPLGLLLIKVLCPFKTRFSRSRLGLDAHGPANDKHCSGYFPVCQH